MSVETPLVAGAIYGVRTWGFHWKRGQLVLSAAYQKTAWSPGTEPTKAACVGPYAAGHDAPSPGCSCGIYAIHPHRAPDWDGLVSTWSDGEPLLLGMIEAWGRVELHADGFRAEFARPNAIVSLPIAAHEDAERAAAALGIACWNVADLEELVLKCEARGLGMEESVVDELVPEDSPPDESLLRAWKTASSSPAPPAPVPPATQSLLERVGEWIVMAVVGVFAVFWYGSIAFIVGSVATSLLFGWPFSDETPPVGIGKVRIGRDCSLRASIRSSERWDSLAIQLVAHGTDGGKIGKGLVRIGPVHRGRSTYRLAAVAPKACAKLAGIGAVPKLGRSRAGPYASASEGGR